MRVLFYFYTLAGHNIEYFSHLFRAAKVQKDRVSIFVVPNSEWLSNHSEFKSDDNIIIEYFDADKIYSGNSLHNYWRQYKLIKRVIKKHKPSDLFFEYLMQNIFTIFLMSFKKISFHGIIYKIFLRESGSHITGKTQYFIFALTRSLKSVFILNDQRSTELLNKKYGVNKFKFLPDPIQDKYEELSSAVDYNGEPIKIVHLGALSKRKGVLEILKLALKLEETGCEKFHFTIGGKIDKDIVDEFNVLADKLKESKIITFILGFISYEAFHQQIAESHFILMPYNKVTQSSGLIGFGALYEKPLLYPQYGLIGEICANYQLGFVLNGVDSDSMYEFLMSNSLSKLWDSYKTANNSIKYCEQNSIMSFQQHVFSNFSN